MSGSGNVPTREPSANFFTYLDQAVKNAHAIGPISESVTNDVEEDKNAVPGDPQKPWITSGIRLGTPALSTRGFGTDEMRSIAGWIARVLDKPDDAATAQAVAREVRELASGYPLFAWEPARR